MLVKYILKKDSTKLEKSLSINEVQGKVNGKNQDKKGHWRILKAQFIKMITSH